MSEKASGTAQADASYDLLRLAIFSKCKNGTLIANCQHYVSTVNHTM